MVAGHLQEKKGYYYIVLSYPDSSGKRKTKWLTTGLPAKGNNVYAHLDYNSKLSSADAMVNGLSGALQAIK